MHCLTCGTALPENATFCPNCGTPVSDRVSYQERADNPGSSLPPDSPSLSEHGGGVNTLSLTHPVDLEHSSASLHAEAGSETPDAHEEREENANERLILFSDGIIAFAITIAAISIKIPSDPALLANQVTSIFLKYFVYIVSFVVVALAWNEHHRLFHYIKRNDMLLVGLNFWFLASIVLVPIGMYFIEVSTDYATSTRLFLGSQASAGLALIGTWLYASFRRRLVDPDMNRRLIKYQAFRLLFYPALLVVLVVAVFFPLIGLVLFILWIASLILRRLYRRGLNIAAGSDDIGRILLFSDAVIGIAITIVAAQIEFPSFSGTAAGEEVQRTLAESFPLLGSFAIGFVVMGVFWLFHYRMFRYVKRHNPTLIALNFCFLLFIALMFIPINLYAFYSNDATALAFFGVYQTLTALVLVLIWWRAARKRRLLDTKITQVQIRQFSTAVVSNLLILLALTIVTLLNIINLSLLVSIDPRLYLGVYLATLSVVLLVIYFRGRRSMSRLLPSGEAVQRRLPWIDLPVIGGLGGVLAAGIVLLALILLVISVPPSRVLNTFCTALTANDYHTAYNQYSSSAQKDISEDQFTVFYKALGKPTSCKLSHVDDAKRMARLTITFASGVNLVFDNQVVSDKINYQKPDPTPSRTLFLYCVDLASADYQAAYIELSSTAQSSVGSADKLAAAFSSNKVVDCSFSNINDAAATGTISYSYADGSTHAFDYTLVNEHSDWKINTEQAHS